MQIMENIIYDELIIRGYSVDVGTVEIKKQNKERKWIRNPVMLTFFVTQENLYICYTRELIYKHSCVNPLSDKFTIIAFAISFMNSFPSFSFVSSLTGRPFSFSIITSF